MFLKTNSLQTEEHSLARQLLSNFTPCCILVKSCALTSPLTGEKLKHNPEDIDSNLVFASNFHMTAVLLETKLIEERMLEETGQAAAGQVGGSAVYLMETTVPVITNVSRISRYHLPGAGVVKGNAIHDALHFQAQSHSRQGGTASFPTNFNTIPSSCLIGPITEVRFPHNRDGACEHFIHTDKSRPVAGIPGLGGVVFSLTPMYHPEETAAIAELAAYLRQFSVPSFTEEDLSFDFHDTMPRADDWSDDAKGQEVFCITPKDSDPGVKRILTVIGWVEFAEEGTLGL